MRNSFVSAFIVGLFLVLNNSALGDNPQNKNCDQTDCSECPQVSPYPDMGKTELNYKNGEYDGMQRIYYKNGKVWEESIYKNGKIDGIVKIYYKNGDLWEKQIFKNGILLDANHKPWNGPYKRLYKNGQIAAEAQYKDGLPQGEMKSYYENGKIKVIQDFITPERSILKTYTEKGVLKLEENILSNKYDGRQTLYYDNGKIQFEMTFKNNLPLGTRKDYSENGALKDEFTYLEGYKSWKYDEYYENGKIRKSGMFTGQTKADVKAEGITREYNENGQLKYELSYHHNKANGRAVNYYENGKIQSEVNWKDDVPTGIRKDYTKEGVLQAEYKYLDGYNKWEYILFYEDGKLMSSGFYTGGSPQKEMKQEGPYKEYYKNGRLKFEVTYKNNKKDGVQRKYFSDGTLRYEIPFKDGINQTYVAIENKDNILLQEIGVMQKVGDNTSPHEIFEKVKAVYKSWGTIKVKGVVITTTDTGGPKFRIHTDLDMILKKPNLFLITWTQLDQSMKESGAVWNDGQHQYHYMGYEQAYQIMKNEEQALHRASASSGSFENTIPYLFLNVWKGLYSIFDQLKDVKLEGIVKYNNEDCYVISGRPPHSQSVKFWISKSRSLIVKCLKVFDSSKDNLLTDKEIEEVLKNMGQKATESFKKSLRESLKRSQQESIHGLTVEIYNDISSPELGIKDLVL